MGAAKGVLIVIVVVAVIFVVVVVLGAKQNNSEKAPADPQNYTAPSWSQSLSSGLPFSPKLKLQRSTFTVGAVPQEIKIPADMPSALWLALFGHSMRKATFDVSESYPCAGMVFKASAGVGGNLNRQPSKASNGLTETCPSSVGLCVALPPKPSVTSARPNRANFMIPDEGGTITIVTLPGVGSKPCTVELQ